MGSRAGESTPLPPMWPGFDSELGSYVAKFVVASFSAPRGFSQGTPVFPTFKKLALLNSNSNRNARTLNT